MSNNQAKNDPFVLSVAQGGEAAISAQDMLKLLDSLKVDPSSSSDLQTLVESAKNGEPVDRETLMATVANLLANDTQHLGELAGSIGNFEIEF
ncbi:hypothetical protein G6F70_004330 [Rhizopus microsporus]|uniref:Uncharacterized protein n=2 Tax=Rhizopus TaxID=4842 RepID=A0A367J9B8_RHIAZ|nr:hypothetical protein G6F71_004340 [Rhizopus microsporus]RCH86429.1 hypothetical protein CU097_009439 [Rhizopus azygosporus]KAG1200113.1 hypothetical protein G6F70_004330 [Rhizopus microsporus]KAG1211783.1 hypothetical protein G6F69_004296 [Rhizopus microsporus]KAG1233763.1 hypothetical protein G6F67_004044 [Rhizopus microsporus]